jgi:tripartite-type tricarboxylate transporter receptor subunit TctC
VRAGKLRMIAVGAPALAAVPRRAHARELGLKGLDADTIFGFYAPAGARVVMQAQRRINRILAMPRKERINALGGVPAPMSPAEFAAKAAEDSRRFGAIIRERKIIGD